MNLMKKIFTATLVVLILLSVAGIIYVVQFQEAVPEKAKEKEVAVKPAAPKIDSVKKRTSPPARLREVAIIIDDIGYDLNVAKALLKIDADLTFAILPFQRDLSGEQRGPCALAYGTGFLSQGATGRRRLVHGHESGRACVAITEEH